MDLFLLLPLGIVAIAGGAMVLRRPAWGAALILLVVNFEGTLVVGGISLVKLLSIACVGVLLVQIVFAGEEIRFDRTSWLIVLFLLWVGATVFWSADRMGFLREYVSFCLQAFMYILIINLVRSKDDLRLALWGYVAGGTVLAVILAQTMISIDFRRSTDMEVAGLGLNLAARMVGLNLLLAVVLMQLDRRRLPKLVLIGAAVLSGVSSVLALSRGNWYALIISGLVVVVVLSVKKGVISTVKQGVLIGAVGVVALYFAANFALTDYGLSKLGERFTSAYTFSDGASGRFDIWSRALDPFMEKPLAGHGFNSFKRLNEWKHTGAHNAFVFLGVEVGLIGVGLFLLILGSVFLVLWARLREKKVDPLALAWGMGLFVFLITVSGVDTSVTRKYLWFVLGLVSLLVRHYGVGREPAAPRVDRDAARDPAVGRLADRLRHAPTAVTRTAGS